MLLIEAASDVEVALPASQSTAVKPFETGQPIVCPSKSIVIHTKTSEVATASLLKRGRPRINGF